MRQRPKIIEFTRRGSVKHLIALCLLAAIGSILACASSCGTSSEQLTVSRVDLERYMGKWYEIASFPAWFQRDCFCTTAEYELRGDHVSVRNSCRRGSPEGEIHVATAKAFVVPGTRNSRLEVQFFWPFKGDYWIIALDDDYRYAMVGHPSREYLWILSRTPSMPDTLYHNLVEAAHGMGYETTKLKKARCNDDQEDILR